MKYFFILGNNPTLSIAELSAVFGLQYQFHFNTNNIFILETEEKIMAKELIKKLGGTIKIGEIITETKNRKTENLLDIIIPCLNPDSGKYKFGISYYGQNKFNPKPLGMEIKKYLREKNISCRWVTSREKTLSSVVVEQNKLADKGIEIVLIEDKKSEVRPRVPEVGLRILAGRTLAVQPFKELSYRDYGRPERDDRSGMIPPKLAQIMINLSGIKPDENTLILDPFCGSGTILTEAMLMGYKKLIGSDSSKKAIDDTKKNIHWINTKFKIQDSRFQTHNIVAENLSNTIKNKSIDAIITEPYLGPQRGHVDIKKTTKKLENLYFRALSEFKKILKPDGRIVMLWPEFHINQSPSRISPNIHGYKIINPIPEYLQKNKNLNLTDRNTIIYGRPGQKVWREIVVLKKI